MFHNYGLIVPFLITLLYAAHPLHTEVVANIKGRDDMLTFLFMALTLYFLFDYVRKSSVVYLVISVVSYFACLLTKENAVAIIAVIPLTLYVFGEQDIKRSLQLTVPFAAVLLVYLVIRDQVLDSVAFGEDLDIINNTLMAAKTQSEMLATNFVILGKYLALLVYPHPLSFDYSYNQFPIVNWGNWQALLSFAVYLGLGVYATSKILKRDVLAYGILFYLITFSVTSNLVVKIGATLGERFMFIPSLGFAIAFVFLLIKLLKLNESADNKSAHSISQPAAKLLTGVVLIVVIAYSAKTYTRNFDWKNNLTLFRADIDATPNSARTHFSLAATLNTNADMQTDPAVKAQMLQESIAGFQRSVEIYPEFASAWYNMGVAYFNNGDAQNAQIAYENCLLYNTFDKQALNNLGVIYFNRNDYNTAIEYFSRAVKAHSNFPDPYANLGACYHNMGDSQNAIKFYTKALQFNPNNQMVNGNLAKLYSTLGNSEKADYYRKRSGQ
jgi:tetratricopeptide (TPR) repeat protein